MLEDGTKRTCGDFRADSAAFYIHLPVSMRHSLAGGIPNLDIKVLSELVDDERANGSDGDATDLQVEVAHYHLSLVRNGSSAATKD